MPAAIPGGAPLPTRAFRPPQMACVADLYRLPVLPFVPGYLIPTLRQHHPEDRAQLVLLPPLTQDVQHRAVDSYPHPLLSVGTPSRGAPRARRSFLLLFLACQFLPDPCSPVLTDVPATAGRQPNLTQLLQYFTRFGVRHPPHEPRHHTL
jgi:hypothetical protein